MANNKSVDMERVPFLTGDRDHDINELNRVISLGGNVDNFKRALQSYLSQNVISEPDIDPALRNLPVVVAKRVATLESYLQMPEYRSLEIRPGYWTYWAAGRQKSNYLNDPKEIGPIPNEVFQLWIEEENGYRLWMEAPDEPFLQMAAYTAFLPSKSK